MIRICRGGTVSRRVVIAAAALVPLIAGCEAGTAAPVLQWHSPSDGANLTIGYITISNVFVLGAPPGSVLQPGQNADVFFALTNTGSRGSRDRLIGISAKVQGRGGRLVALAQSVRLLGGRVWLNAQHSVRLTGPRPAVYLQDLLRQVNSGSVVWLQFSFAKAGQHTLMVPVLPRSSYYGTLSPAPTPSAVPSPASPAPTPSRSAGTSGHHRRHRSPSPSVSP